MTISPRDRADLLLRVADATMRAGDVARAKHHCLEAHELAQRTNDGERRIAAALAYGEAAWRDAREAATAADLLRGVLPLADGRDVAGTAAGVADTRPRPRRRQRGRARAR